MAQTIADVMTRDPATVRPQESAVEAARRMASTDAGAVLVEDNGKLCGIVTDRDIAVRLVAEGKDPGTPVSEVVSDSELVTVGPDTSIKQAVQLMRRRAVRRLPVVENGRPVGIVSLGDLAMEQDSDSALADISAAKGNA